MLLPQSRQLLSIFKKTVYKIDPQFLVPSKGDIFPWCGHFSRLSVLIWNLWKDKEFCSCFVVLVPQMIGSPRFKLASYSGNLVAQLN